MVQNETNMVVADNSGAKSVRIFRLYGGSKMKILQQLVISFFAQ